MSNTDIGAMWYIWNVNIKKTINRYFKKSKYVSGKPQGSGYYYIFLGGMGWGD